MLDSVYLNTIQQDIVKRFNIADTNKLDAVVKYMFDNIGNETSIRNIEKGLNVGGHKISVPTIDTMVQGLLDSFLLYKCDRYDIKVILERELAPLEAIEDNYPKFLLTMDFGSGENNGIKRINVLEWLLG